MQANAETINGHAQPLVSVVIPTYNFGKLLGYTLDSLLAQTYQHWECIVVDDGSKDNTEAVMAAYLQKDSRFRYHKQQNAGPAKARNTGINQAQGDWLQFLDADDLLEPNKLQHQITIVSSHPEVDVVYGPVCYFRSEPAAPEKVGNLGPDVEGRPAITGQGYSVLKAFLKSTVCVNAPLVKRSLATKLHNLDESLIQSEDWDFYLRAASQGASFYYHDNPDGARALIRKHDSNSTGDFFRLEYYVVKMRRKFAQTCTDANLLEINRQLMLKNLENLIFQVQKNLQNGQRGIAIKRSFKAFGLNPTFRYFVYAVVSVFASYTFYRKATAFSFSKLLKG